MYTNTYTYTLKILTQMHTHPHTHTHTHTQTAQARVGASTTNYLSPHLPLASTGTERGRGGVEHGGGIVGGRFGGGRDGKMMGGGEAQTQTQTQTQTQRVPSGVVGSAEVGAAISSRKELNYPTNDFGM